jgi:hypothetical protein
LTKNMLRADYFFFCQSMEKDGANRAIPFIVVRIFFTL